MSTKKSDHIGEFLTQPMGKPTWCRVRIYDGEKPLILLSSLPENRGPSLANTVEFVSTEVVVGHFPHLTHTFPSLVELLRRWRGLEVPFGVVEHFSTEGFYRDLERFTFVEFTDASIRCLGGGLRRLGHSSWRESTTRTEVERLAGESI